MDEFPGQNCATPAVDRFDQDRPCQTAGFSSAAPIGRRRNPFVDRPTHCRRTHLRPGQSENRILAVGGTTAMPRHFPRLPAERQNSSLGFPLLAALRAVGPSHQKCMTTDDANRLPPALNRCPAINAMSQTQRSLWFGPNTTVVHGSFAGQIAFFSGDKNRAGGMPRSL
jgi:hypothetical protein